MIGPFKRMFKRGRNQNREIDPDEIFLDSSNLPEFDTSQFEGRMEKPIPRKVLFILGAFFFLISVLFLYKVGKLQIVQGEKYAKTSMQNHLRNTLIFAHRGAILDRNAVLLAGNIPGDSDENFLGRKYSDILGMSHIIGYIKYPKKDSSGFYYTKELKGYDGVEKQYDADLSGENGLKIVETNALGALQSESVIRPPQDGKNLTLTIDSRVQSKFFELIGEVATDLSFQGGAGVIMDITDGGVLALASYPEYKSSVMTEGDDGDTIKKYLTDKRTPFLDRIISGAYTPGSIVKPFMATGALNEKVITSEKQILSTGSISIPNPYNPKEKSVFLDWRPQGWVDIRKAIAVSSNVFFYEVGGGFENQKGLGITNIEKYARLYGLGEKTGIDLPGEVSGVIPNPSWKALNFDGDAWRVGDTYHTVIGQYGFQVTPLQMVRGIAAIANFGKLITPHVVVDDKDVFPRDLKIPRDVLKVVQEGMRQTVTLGTAPGLKFEDVHVAAKTGTAQVGISKQRINSWVVGFFPYENPRFAFTLMMETGPNDSEVGAVRVMRQMIDWMRVYTPEYMK